MTTIPKEIQKKMHRLAQLSKEAKSLDLEINNWFIAHGYETDPFCKYSLNDDNGISLSELGDGNDITDNFVADFEAGKYEHCRYF